jgi:uncharacterized protein (TIGR03083 family)
MASCPWDPGRAAMSGHLELTYPEAIRSNIGIVNFDESRSCFRSAAHSFVELVDEVRPEQWMLPALGVWDVRSLVGHTARALSTIEAYLAIPSQGPGPDSPVAYFLSVLSSDHESEERKRQDAAIAERGRQAGAELGADPAKTVREITMRVLARVDAAPDEALLATPAGSMTLGAYLPTRTFELTVHSLDLARTLDMDPPVGLTPAIAACCELAGALAVRRPNAASILLTLTGRNDHALGASVL